MCARERLKAFSLFMTPERGTFAHASKRTYATKEFCSVGAARIKTNFVILSDIKATDRHGYSMEIFCSVFFKAK